MTGKKCVYDYFLATRKIRQRWQRGGLIFLTLFTLAWLSAATSENLHTRHNIHVEQCQVISCVPDARQGKTCVGDICVPTPPTLIHHDCTVMFLESGVVERMYLTTDIKDAKVNATQCSRRELNKEMYPRRIKGRNTHFSNAS